MVVAHVAIITFHFPEGETNQPDQPLMAVSTTTGQAHTCNLQAFAPASVSESYLIMLLYKIVKPPTSHETLVNPGMKEMCWKEFI
jgi:hypothetical protein